MTTFHNHLVQRATFAIAAISLLALTPTARAASMFFDIEANGLNEVNAAGVPNQGDPDGLAIGTLTLDNGTGAGTSGSATFSLQLSNLELSTLTGHHIHQAPATTTGSIVVDFGDPDNVRTGTTLSGTVSNLPAATITAIFANPTGFYYNLHNTQFPAGAVRDQLVPEPTSAALLLVGAAVFLRRRSHP